MARGAKARRRRRRRLRWVPAVALLLVGGLWLLSLRYAVAVGGDYRGSVSLSIARGDGWPGTYAFRWHADAAWCFVTVQSNDGHLIVVRWRPDEVPKPLMPREWPGVGLYRSGYGGVNGRRFFGAATSVVIAYWLICLPPAAIVAGQLLAARRRRVPAGHCPGCGYDLRASPERCPECGHAVA